jgi:hypothetical protein
MLETNVQKRLNRLLVRIGETLKRLRWTSVRRWWLAWISGAWQWVLGSSKTANAACSAVLTPIRSASFRGHNLGTWSRDMSPISDLGYSGRPCDMERAQVEHVRPLAPGEGALANRGRADAYGCGYQSWLCHREVPAWGARNDRRSGVEVSVRGPTRALAACEDHEHFH